MGSHRAKLIVGRILVITAALISYAYVASIKTPAGAAAAFTLSTICLIAGIWPHYGAALITAGLIAFGFAGTIDTLNGWNVAAMLLSAAGAGLSLRRHPVIAWICASWPFWAMEGTLAWLGYVAVGLVFAGLVTGVARPYMMGKRVVRPEPDPRLSSGPLIDVPERVYQFRGGRLLLKITLAISGILFVAGAVMRFAGSRENGLVLLLVGAMLGFSFAFAFWLNSRGRYRIDPTGVHGRALLWESSIPWAKVCGLFLRYQYMPGLGQRWIYYCILAPRSVISFPHTLPGCNELCDFIEKATGMKWPTPQI